MSYILDTHAFLWFAADDPNLSGRAKRIIENPRSKIFLSAAVVWEISIKAKIGKIELKTSLDNFITEAIRRYNFTPLPVTIQHAARVYKLKDIHKDPFDRILIAQSVIEKATLITSDRLIKKYRLDVVW